MAAEFSLVEQGADVHVFLRAASRGPHNLAPEVLEDAYDRKTSLL